MWKVWEHWKLSAQWGNIVVAEAREYWEGGRLLGREMCIFFSVIQPTLLLSWNRDQIKTFLILEAQWGKYLKGDIPSVYEHLICVWSLRFSVNITPDNQVTNGTDLIVLSLHSLSSPSLTPTHRLEVNSSYQVLSVCPAQPGEEDGERLQSRHYSQMERPAAGL